MIPEALRVYAPVGAVDVVLALDRPSMPADAYDLHEFGPGQRFEIGPFVVDTWLLPHFVPNAGIRLSADGTVLAYTGDTGPSEDVPRLARDADVLLPEATCRTKSRAPTRSSSSPRVSGAGTPPVRAPAG